MVPLSLPSSWKRRILEKLESVGAKKLGGQEAMKLANQTLYRLPVFCSELLAINRQFRAIASRLPSLPAFAIILPCIDRKTISLQSPPTSM
jgi:hypothetical protein